MKISRKNKPLKDRKSETLIFAHDWEILGDDRISRWDDKDRSKWADRRALDVKIYSFVGTSALGAKHYTASVEEEENQWWSEGENAWVRLSCDSNNRGYSMRAECLSEAEAISMAKIFVEIVAGKERKHHRVSWDGPGCPRGWGL